MKVNKALTIAGSDSGGGAGIQADLKTFQELGVFGMSALTAVTAQNTKGVQGVYPLTAEAVSAQIQSIGEDLRPDAVKTGMLFSADIIESVSNEIVRYGWKNVAIDPVMIAKGGASLLQNEAILAMKKHLIPLSLVITPNIPEAEVLTDIRIRSLEDKREAAKKLHHLGAKNVIIKGGHDEAKDIAADLLFDGERFSEFKSSRIQTANTHGTGCTYSAAITAGLADGLTVPEAVDRAKKFIQAAIENDLGIGSGHGPTNHWAFNKRKKEAEVYGC
ncbi:bifunctional hydroxymethylpyrimidine kinase/phosphomethylpyrimidine kinase [Cytobacillus oceanisediminis]|uniref:bifunctional hydroxymethylpyrimidine kinase/phosphomethylpyrimidine kinase n=1 Tax=Cytobacillus oceanisediminis TaxID=665099 RepID=UPI001863F2FF|nr:bifunctional hydroxymethylpyrimidine kinase/phosphomethylpyrimidine kinase [Cytobacillus oceanisediminis]MCM3402516.1 bifunctional hydroxymethylpyrimidine kinase/phosphomethylpyrimidine kinase [Cytobacillus oceanisediminis]MDK7667483.1 bifunctional hydroxymethylpyrimidine kinase/phosphomethylpyrimidine kinase [Cytobacillus oceanisediminis]QOK28623.1 bifunctional hydroxymethylpyrimidine kinase/phosphomethylpyrimidine kinase [Cytobacillus oceanisediminis]